MERKFKVIDSRIGLPKGSMLEAVDNTDDMFTCTSTLNNPNGYCKYSITLDLDSIEPLIEEGYLIEVKEDKIKDIKEYIDGLIEQYTKDNDALLKEFEEGNVQPCVKVEAETVYFNLMKVLNSIKEKINE